MKNPKENEKFRLLDKNIDRKQILFFCALKFRLCVFFFYFFTRRSLDFFLSFHKNIRIKMLPLFMNSEFSSQIDHVKKIFSQATTPEMRYRLLIEMGKTLPKLSADFRIPDHRVEGCQSNVYLNASLIDGKLYFKAYSDSMISAGMTALLITVYQGQEPSVVLQSSPSFIKELNIEASLSPSRSNGLYHIYLYMKKLSLQLLVEHSRS